jgi:hypothetical protein
VSRLQVSRLHEGRGANGMCKAGRAMPPPALEDYALHLQHHHVQVVLRRLKARGTQVNVIARAAE